MPLLLALWFSGNSSRHRWRRDFLLGYVAGLTFFWISFYWLTTVTGIGWFALEFYLAIFFAAWSWFVGRLRGLGETRIWRKDKWSSMLAAAKAPASLTDSPFLSSGHNLILALLLSAAWVAQEWIRGWLFSGFGWNGLGVALHSIWPLIQIAEFTGVAGVTFLVAFGNVILATTAIRLFVETRARLMRPHFDLTLSLAGLMGIFVLGINAAHLGGETHPFRVALVQPAVPREDKFDLRNKQEIFDKFARFSEIALTVGGHCDLIVWPESAMPAPVLQDEETGAFVQAIAEKYNLPILLGAIDVDGDRAFNAAILATAGKPPQLYRKVHLVPFGEYVPFRHSFPLFAQIVGDQVPADFDAGTEYRVFEMPGNGPRLAPLICFEDTLGDLTRRFVTRGADLLVNVTNDGWFLRSAGSRQHLANAVFRCVENRRPMVRAANTGVTCFVNQAGRVTQILRDDRGSVFDEGTLVGNVNLSRRAPITFYTEHGELFAQICSVLALLATAFCVALASLQRPRGVAR